MEDKAEIYAGMIRRMLLQYDGIERELSRQRPAETEAVEPVTTAALAAEENEAAAAMISGVWKNQANYGLTPGEISDIFERDARRY